LAARDLLGEKPGGRLILREIQRNEFGAEEVPQPELPGIGYVDERAWYVGSLRADGWRAAPDTARLFVR
jgi:hypothetical protein